MLGIFTVSVLLVSCGTEVDESAVLMEYLEGADSPFDIASIKGITTAQSLDGAMTAGVDSIYVMDIRSADAYNAGHIPGAVNVAPGDVVSHLDGLNVGDIDQIVITCVTGQTAGWATALARMAGYDAKSLKWGMSSWNSEFATTLDGKTDNSAATLFETAENAKPEAGSFPVLETTFETAEEILDAQINAVLAEGFGAAAIDASTVLGSEDDYFVINYWNPTHYALGHIKGAIMFDPTAEGGSDLGYDKFLNTLPTDGTPIVVYCYTGQTSAFVTAYLKVLGYNAKSLKFGVNGMAHQFAIDNNLTHWSATETNTFDYE